MNSPATNVDSFKPLGLVLDRDEAWGFLDGRTLERHHNLIAGYALHAGVPASVAQHYENARNTWLYSFFCYRLVQVAILQVHLAGEAAIKERARIEGINSRKTLMELLDIALKNRWLLDANFEITADRFQQETKHLELLRFLGVVQEPFVGPLHEQDYAKRLIDAFRMIRNALAHGEVILKHNLGLEFLTVRDMINQLFPAPQQ